MIFISLHLLEYQFIEMKIVFLILLLFFTTLLLSEFTPVAASSATTASHKNNNPYSIGLPFPSLIIEIEPTLSFYSPFGDPPCFIVPTTHSIIPAITTKDLMHIAEGHGALESHRIIFITHSFRESISTPWLYLMKNAIQQKEPNTTVVLLGWGGGADIPHYRKAAGNIRSVGLWLADIISELRKMHPRLYIWGIGHSLGAHLMGLAGRESLKNRGGFNRITGLDPAGPYFEGKDDDLRLRRGDAQIVDVIHSDGCSPKTTPDCWLGINNHYASPMPMGTIDFYPNFGEMNPAANLQDIGRSHTRAVNLFIASIYNKGLFRTNETLEGISPSSPQSLSRVRSVPETAEMGYWLEMGFIPQSTNPRTTFYIGPETLKTLETLGDYTTLGGVRGRFKRALVKAVDCLIVPHSGASHHHESSTFILTILGLIVAYFISMFDACIWISHLAFSIHRVGDIWFVS